MSDFPSELVEKVARELATAEYPNSDVDAVDPETGDTLVDLYHRSAKRALKAALSPLPLPVPDKYRDGVWLEWRDDNPLPSEWLRATWSHGRNCWVDADGDQIGDEFIVGYHPGFLQGDAP